MTTPSEPATAPGLAAPAPTPEAVRRMLAGVMDPELHTSIVDLGMVDEVRVTPDGDVIIKVALTTAGCPLRHQI